MDKRGLTVSRTEMVINQISRSAFSSVVLLFVLWVVFREKGIHELMSFSSRVLRVTRNRNSKSFRNCSPLLLKLLNVNKRFSLLFFSLSE